MNTPAPSQRVLLVDDEPRLLATLRRVIEKICPATIVIYASDLATAEWQLRSTTVRLVFTDLYMANNQPRGLKVIAIARELGIPVAVVTGAEGKVVDDLIAANVKVISKSRLNMEELGAVLRGALED